MHATYRKPQNNRVHRVQIKKSFKIFSIHAGFRRTRFSRKTRGHTGDRRGHKRRNQMERDKYLKMCQRASYKTALAGAWWAAKWDASELVEWRGSRYVPFDYRFGFRAGEVTGVAILHSLKTNSAVEASLKEVEEHL